MIEAEFDRVNEIERLALAEKNISRLIEQFNTLSGIDGLNKKDAIQRAQKKRFEAPVDEQLQKVTTVKDLCAFYAKAFTDIQPMISQFGFSLDQKVKQRFSILVDELFTSMQTMDAFADQLHEIYKQVATQNNYLSNLWENVIQEKFGTHFERIAVKQAPFDKDSFTSTLMQACRSLRNGGDDYQLLIDAHRRLTSLIATFDGQSHTQKVIDTHRPFCILAVEHMIANPSQYEKNTWKLNVSTNPYTRYNNKELLQKLLQALQKPKQD